MARARPRAALQRRPIIPFNWRGWWDFGTGALGDMACHTMNLPFMALQLGAPTAVSADVGAAGQPRDRARGLHRHLRVPGARRAARRALYLVRTPPAAATDACSRARSRAAAAASWSAAKGTLYSASDYGDSDTLLPEELRELSSRRSRRCRVRRAITPSGFAPARAARRRCRTSSITPPADRDGAAGQRRDARGPPDLWDSANLRVTNVPSADQIIHRTYRRGWELHGEPISTTRSPEPLQRPSQPQRPAGATCAAAGEACAAARPAD